MKGTKADFKTAIKKLVQAAEETTKILIHRFNELEDRAIKAEAREAELQGALKTLLEGACNYIAGDGVCPGDRSAYVSAVKKAEAAIACPRPIILNRVEKLEKALRTIEWSKDPFFSCCPICYMNREDGHQEDCMIKQALEKSGVVRHE